MAARAPGAGAPEAAGRRSSLREYRRPAGRLRAVTLNTSTDTSFPLATRGAAGRDAVPRTTTARHTSGRRRAARRLLATTVLAAAALAATTAQANAATTATFSP